MNTRETLVAARALISDPERWTTGVPARAEDGRMCDPDAPAAVRWCAMGALLAVGPIEDSQHPYNALWGAAMTIYDTGVVTVNEDLGHAAVLRLYDYAIATKR